MKPSGNLTLEQLRVAESRARARVEANRPGDRELALRALRQITTRIANTQERRPYRHDHETRTVEDAARFEERRAPESVRVGSTRMDVWDVPGADEL